MQNRKELRANVAKLYDMVVELKDQVEKNRCEFHALHSRNEKSPADLRN